MKKILLMLALFGFLHQLNAQRIKVDGKVPQKGLNAPKNYFGYRPQYKDTLYVDFGKGQKIEIIYRWFDLFREDEAKFQKYFWKPFQAKYNLLKEKIEELPLEENTKYIISIKEETKKSHFNIQTAFHYNDQEAMAKISREKYNADGKLKTQYYQGVTANVSDSTALDSINNYILGNYPKESIIEVIERKQDLQHREYRLEGNKLVGQAQWQHIIEVNEFHWKVRYYVNDIYDLSAFESIDLSAFIRSERENFLRKKYYMSHTVLKYVVTDGEVKYQYTYGERKRSRTRFKNVRWSPVLGTSITNGLWSADVGAQIGISFNDKQQWANRLSLRYQLKGFGIEDGIGRSMSYNGFVDAMWDINYGEDYKREQWLGAGLGYLVHKDGNIYGDNTARIFLKYRSSQLWGVQPEFNYSFNDHKGFIGLGFFFSL